ncbi:MAG TPA: ATP-binding protein, partial [Spirochaetia bacterium]|nr:ATP-binding protein [Spirochaetia bacterium]
MNTAKGKPGKKRMESTAGRNTGKLRIGDNWNAISIIALSQNNPLKAIAEFIENSIDARARNITIVRGKERGEPYLKVIDDGSGIPLNSEGIPDFRYVATHICDSIKRRLKDQGVKGIQGEYGIGLLSFWTVGDRMILSSPGTDGKIYQMVMQRNDPGYTIIHRRMLFSHPGTELIIRPLLPGLRMLKGERIQSYLASELRDRIRKSGVRITVRDRQARKELEVQPRQYSGRLLRDLEILDTGQGQIYLELYVDTYSPENKIGL